MAESKIQQIGLTSFKDTGTLSSIASTTDGTILTGSDVALAYDATRVYFNARVQLSTVTAGVRPVITFTHSSFKDCPSFIARGSPVFRGAAGSAVATDECYASHTKGNNTIIIQQNNFISNPPAGFATFQICGTVPTT